MYRLMIADDEERIRNGLRNFFPWESIGFQVVATAKNGQEVLNYLVNHDIDVLLCDIRMPCGDGLFVAQRIQEEHRDIKIILLSAYQEFEYAKRAIELGVSGYITKPTQYNDIEQTFQRLFAQEENDAESVENRITRIQRYISNHLSTASLESIADYMQMNPQYICKYFRKQTGETFSDYLLKARMEKASFLLRNTQLKIYQISEAVGYSTPQDFSRVFKKFYSKAPGEYRQDE